MGSNPTPSAIVRGWLRTPASVHGDSPKECGLRRLAGGRILFQALPTEVIRISSPSESSLGHLSSPQSRYVERFSLQPRFRCTPFACGFGPSPVLRDPDFSQRGKSLKCGAFSGTDGRYAVGVSRCGSLDCAGKSAKVPPRKSSRAQAQDLDPRSREIPYQTRGFGRHAPFAMTDFWRGGRVAEGSRLLSG